MVGLSVTKALKVLQRCKHATPAAVIHHIGSANRFSVYPVFHQLIRGHVSCFEKLHNERCIYYKFTNMINCFNISDLHVVENNPLVGMLAILTYNESVFQSYQFAETVICWKKGVSLYYSIILQVLTSEIYEIS